MSIKKITKPKIKVSIVVLTFCRPDELRRNISEILCLNYENLEVIVVDNASDIPASNIISDPRVKVIRCDENGGVAGRNVGILESKGEIVVTLDDDVFGFNDDSLVRLISCFEKDSSISAINFKVIDDLDEEQINWIHHRKIEIYGDKTFDTYEISEGAVAFRREHLMKTSLYPDYFFISHEGPDLAIQIIKNDGRVIYLPDVVVRHAHAAGGRVNWRRYYYDTRNQIWLSVRHYPVSMAAKKLVVGLGALFVYSVRDHYFKYFVKAIFDALKNIGRPCRERNSLKGLAFERYKEIESNNPSVFYMIKKRFFLKGVRI